MRKKFTMIISMLILSLLLAGCSIEVHEDPNKQKSVYYLYDISADETQLQKESYFPEETTAEYMLKDMMQRMNSQEAARSPAFAPPLIATVATGIPDGICTME